MSHTFATHVFRCLWLIRHFHSVRTTHSSRDTLTSRTLVHTIHPRASYPRIVPGHTHVAHPRTCRVPSCLVSSCRIHECTSRHVTEVVPVDSDSLVREVNGKRFETILPQVKRNYTPVGNFPSKRLVLIKVSIHGASLTRGKHRTTYCMWFSFSKPGGHKTLLSQPPVHILNRSFPSFLFSLLLL